MKIKQDYEKSFYDVGGILQKCKTYDVAEFIVTPYVVYEITDATINDRIYYMFVEDGIYVIKTDKVDNILEVFAFNYSDFSSEQKYKLFEDINSCQPADRFKKLISYVRR